MSDEMAEQALKTMKRKMNSLSHRLAYLTNEYYDQVEELKILRNKIDELQQEYNEIEQTYGTLKRLKRYEPA